MQIRNFGMRRRIPAPTLTLTFLLAVAALGGAREAKGQSIPQYGLEWPGDGAIRRMLYWHNPFPIYDATYVFKVYPRKKTGTYTYYTTFFWCNDGTAMWDGPRRLQNTYYGAHPYPTPAPHGAGQWELSVNSNDYTTGVEVQWDRWYTQVVRVWRESATTTHHEFYWDWPNTSRVIKKTLIDADWAARNPPTPAIVIGQSPNVDGLSWGGYPGWEEFKGVISGIQMYSGLLSMSDVAAEVSSPLSTAAGRNFIWYLNTNPRPSDVTDKKGIGIPHHPSWDGTTALEWSNGSTPPPPSISDVTSTDVTTSSATIRWTTSTSSDSRVEFGTTTAYGQTTTDPALVTTHAVALASLVAGTTYHYRVHSTDVNANTATSGDFTFTTAAAADTTPPVISSVAATSITTSGATILWSTNEAADSQVDYGTTANYGQTTPVSSSLVTAHSLPLGSLAAGTTYHYRVRSKDAAGNAAVSGDFTFTTTSASDTTPPTISGVAATDVTATSAVIRWTTNEAADSQVDYGTTKSYGQTTPLDATPVTTHAVSLSGLTASTTYHVRARSRDAASNLATGGDVTFTTSAAGTAGNNPVAAYGMNEAQGTVTADASGHGFAGTLVNGPVWTSGRSGSALLFDGINDKVVLPSTVDISQLPFTFEAWIRPTNRNDYHAIFSKRASNSASQMRFGVTIHADSGRLFLTSQQSFLLFWHQPPLNTWEHIAIVATTSGTQLYVNGVAWEQRGAFALGTRADAPVAIGNTPDDDDPFAGSIDDVRLYDRALSQSEIQADMNSGL